MDAHHQADGARYPVSLFSISILVSVGLSAAALSPELPSTLLLLAMAIAGVWLCLPWWNVFLVATGWLLLGYCWSAACCQATLATWLPAGDENRDIVISGHVLDFPQPREQGWQFDFYADQLGGKIRLSLHAPYNRSADVFMPVPRLDCHYRLQVQLKRPRGLLNFGLYDYQAWLLQSGYRATGYVRHVVDCEEQSPSRWLAWRAQLADNITSVPMSERARSTLLALLIGSYADIDRVQWQVLRDSGTIHLLSVSGLHIVLIAALAHLCVYHTCRFLVVPVRWWPADNYAACAALFFAIFYACLAGFSVATQRSLIMVAVAVLQRLFYGRLQFGTTLLIALLLVLLSNPLSIFSSGFWFSFWATAVLVYSSKTELREQVAGSWRQWLLDAVRPQWLVFVLLAPMLLYVYGRMPLLSLPLNFFAVPWVSYISLPIAFTALALLPVSACLASFLLKLSAWTLDIYWQAMEWGIAAGGNAHIDLGGITLWPLILSLTGLVICFLLPASTKHKKFLWRISGLALCLPMFFSGSKALQQHELEMTVLDVGQGLSVIVRTASHVLVYDTGDKRSERFDSGRDIVAPALRNLRMKKIDMLVLSHSDSDHAGGAPGLLQEFTSKQQWSGTPDSLPEPHTFLPCRAGMHWRWDGVDFYVVHPADNRGDTTNNRGCVIRIDTGNKSILLAADIEQAAEEAILARGENLHADVLVSPHHGSKSSSSEAFLQAVEAQRVVISSGYHNRYHHPSPEVMTRYARHHMQVFNTAETGAVRIRLLQAGLDAGLAVCEHNNFWRDKHYCHPH